MECVLKNNCFDKSLTSDLSMLLQCVAYNHKYNTITVKDPAILETSLVKGMDKRDRDVLVDFFNAQVIGSTVYEGEKIEVDAQGTKEDVLKIFTPGEAVRYIGEPLTILVENDLYDGRFVGCVINSFANDRVKNAYKDGFIRNGLSGGCGNAKNTLASRMKTFKWRSKFLRILVIWDSDKEYPNKPDTKYDNDIRELNSKRIKHHVLYKREMENYLPEEAVKDLALPKFESWYNAYKYLTDEQKDSYDMNEGFKYEKIQYDSSNRQELPEKIKTLFSSVSDANFDLLKEGLKIGNFKDTYSKAFETSPHVNKASLLSRTANQPNPLELQDIADTINQLL